MELVAGLSVTTKAVERTAEGIGADIEMRQQHELILHARTKDASRIRFWNPLVPGPNSQLPKRRRKVYTPQPQVSSLWVTARPFLKLGELSGTLVIGPEHSSCFTRRRQHLRRTRQLT